MIEHFVLLAAREGALEQIDTALDRFLAEIAEHPPVVEITAGRNFNRAGEERGWTHGMLVRLTDRDALPGYWEHPAHVRLVSALDESCSDRFAIDYEIEKG